MQSSSFLIDLLIRRKEKENPMVALWRVNECQAHGKDLPVSPNRVHTAAQHEIPSLDGPVFPGDQCLSHLLLTDAFKYKWVFA